VQIGSADTTITDLEEDLAGGEGGLGRFAQLNIAGAGPVLHQGLREFLREEKE
jgi:hypothetical protein